MSESETRPPEGQPNLEYVLEHFGDEDRARAAEAELAALRARCEQLRGERDEREERRVHWHDAYHTLYGDCTKLNADNAALRAENAKYREMLSMCGDVAAAMLLPAEDDTDWQALKRDIDTALGNAQEARDANQ